MKRFVGIALIGLLAISVFSINSLAYAQAGLKDVPGHLFEFEITKLVETGVIKGFPDGTFKPDASITRADVAIILAGAKKLAIEKPAVSPFKDLATTHYAYGHIVAVNKAGFMRGYPDRTFKPTNNITRSEIAALLGQVKGLAAAAAKITKPIVFSQDESAIPAWAVPWVTLAVRSENQYLHHRNDGVFRIIAPLAAATRGDVAYGVYQVTNPPKRSSVVNVTMGQEPDTLHGWIGTMAAMQVVANCTATPSVGRENTWALYPGNMSVIPTIENGLWKVVGTNMEVTYRIREGIKFHDGKPATIDDWAYAFMVFMDPMTPVVSRIIELKTDFTKGAGAYGIKGFDVLDPLSVKVYFKELDFRVNLGLIGGGLYPKHVLETPFTEMKKTGNVDLFRKDETMSRKPISTGAYSIVEWKPGVHILLKANPDFLLGKPNVDTIVFRFILDTTALLARIISGKDNDVTAIGISTDQGIQLEARKSTHTKVHFISGLTWDHMGFNLDNPVLADIRVRKAFIQGIDRASIVRVLFQGKNPVADGFYAPGHFGYDAENVVKYSYNPAASRKLLDEAGWIVGADGFRYKGGKRLTIILETTAGNAMRESIQSICKTQLRDVGIDLDISKNRPAGAFFAPPYFLGRQWPDMVLFAWLTSPTSIGDTIFRADSIPSVENGYEGQNVYGWRNAEATELLKKAATEMSDAERRKLCVRVQYLITDELPVVPMFFRTDVNTSKINMASVKPIALAGQYITWNCYNWYFR